MKRWLFGIFFLLCLSACKDISPQQEDRGERAVTESLLSEEEAQVKTEEEPQKEREAVKVKGIYLTAGTAGTEETMTAMIENIKQTEINAVVIDVKDDRGRITFEMDTPLVQEIGACQVSISDIEDLMRRLKEANIYTIARVVAFRDPYLAEQKPEWSLHDADGSMHRDASGLAWVNPYKEEVWDYLVEVGKAAGEAGFDEVQFDYIRFATDSSMRTVVFDEADTRGRSKTDVITEFVAYAYEQLADSGVFVSADVFGTIIGSAVDANSVGQIYEDMAEHLDYICPMIYPSHYGEGNFGLDYPDLHPYETILGALRNSERVLRAAARGEKSITEQQEEQAQSEESSEAEELHMDEVQEASLNGRRPHVLAAEIQEEMESKAQFRQAAREETGVEDVQELSWAKVRPWLQDFTASYLKNYREYGPEEIREQIQAVYDAGYEEWILWNASNRYTWEGLEPAASEEASESEETENE
ncbi:MAG: putative glycoside hydrolase [bacterium]|nr:putative glycoside hydrolase [bacterium]